MSVEPTKAELRFLESRRLRKARAKAVAKARRQRDKGDRGRERDNGYLAYLRRLPCCVRHLGGCGGRTDPAHVRFADAGRGKPLTGLQTKPDDRWCLPVCRTHHEAQHATNERAFWQAAGIDPLTLSERLYAAYKGNPA